VSEPMQLIVCTFDAVDKGDEVQTALAALDKQMESIKLGNIAVVQKTPEGEIRFHETADHRHVLSEITGAVAGGVAWFVYAFAGSLGYMAGPAAYQEGYNTAERLVRDAGFPDAALAQVGEHLTAGSSALITLVHPHEAPIVTAELQRLGGTIVEHAVPPEVVAELMKE
jgi:uncharacterized membrane protein